MLVIETICGVKSVGAVTTTVHHVLSSSITPSAALSSCPSLEGCSPDVWVRGWGCEANRS